MSKSDKRRREYLVRQQKYAMDHASAAMDRGNEKGVSEAIEHVAKCGHAMGIGRPEKRERINRTFVK